MVGMALTTSSLSALVNAGSMKAGFVLSRYRYELADSVEHTIYQCGYGGVNEVKDGIEIPWNEYRMSDIQGYFFTVAGQFRIKESGAKLFSSPKELTSILPSEAT